MCILLFSSSYNSYKDSNRVPNFCPINIGMYLIKMDQYMEKVDKHLTNFSQFAGQFTKVFIPIVDTAIKMSTDEPVSAFGVYKAAKNMANGDKKCKKNQNSSAKGKNTGKLLLKKQACASSSKKSVDKLKTTASGQGKSLENKNVYNGNSRHSHTAETREPHSTNKCLDADDLKNITNNKKKNYFSNQMETYAAQLEDSDESFSSEDLEENEVIYSDFDSISNEYTNNDSGGLSNIETSGEQGDQAAEMAQTLTKTKKRKNPEVDFSKTKLNNTTTTVLKSKKTKKIEHLQTSRKSLPATVAAKTINEDRKRRSISYFIDNFPNRSIPKFSDVSVEVSKTYNVKLEPLLPPSNIVKLNSIEEGKRAFKWLLNPVTVDEFFAKNWEQKACLIKREQSNYFGHLISFESIDQMLLKNHVEFTKNIDVTSYKNGVRETLNPEGRALPPVVWDHYGQGCSIRLLNPQTFLPDLFTLNTTLQEYFHCLVGANAYLTPPNSQGFAPHYDDIEAFVLQIEGRKRWKLYKPLSTMDILPRYSSKNFTQEEIGKPVLEEVLQPGDVLYFPRGTIHQACTEPGYHSLHITLSVYQKQSFADLFEKMLPVMLQKAINTNLELRRGLPLYAWQNAGIAFSENSTKERTDLIKKVTQLMQKCIRDMPLEEIMDAGIDQLAKKFQHEALPPEIFPAEKLRTVFGSRSRTNERGECVCDYDIDERTNIRLLRANILRLVEEEEKLRIYYYLDNSKEYCEYEPNFIEIEAMEAASVEVLIKSYPEYVGVSQLPLPTDEQKVTLVTALWERGLLMMEKPFR